MVIVIDNFSARQMHEMSDKKNISGSTATFTSLSVIVTSAKGSLSDEIIGLVKKLPCLATIKLWYIVQELAYSHSYIASFLYIY